MEVPNVSWKDVHGAGIAGRDIVRLRRHVAGGVRGMCVWCLDHVVEKHQSVVSTVRVERCNGVAEHRYLYLFTTR